MAEKITMEDAPSYIQDAAGYGLDRQIQELVCRGKLPKDIILKLSTFGGYYGGGRIVEFRQGILQELVDYAEAKISSDALSEDARNLLSPGLPSVFRNEYMESSRVINSYCQEGEGPFYLKSDMVDVVKARRESDGKTLKSSVNDGHRTWTELGICKGIAHGVWRAMLLRNRPLWMSHEGLDAFWGPSIARTNAGITINLDNDYPLLRRRLVSESVFSDEAVTKTYREARDIGLAGIGRVGLSDLCSLLAEHTPALDPDYIAHQAVV